MRIVPVGLSHPSSQPELVELRWSKLAESFASELVGNFLSFHTTPTIEPRMITTPMAMRYDIKARTTPIGPYFFSLPMTIFENTKWKTIAMPTQQIAVAIAERESVPPRDAAGRKEPHGEPPEEHEDDQPHHR